MNYNDIFLKDDNIRKIKDAGRYGNSIEVINELVLVNTEKDIGVRNLKLAKAMSNDNANSDMGQVVGYVIKNVGNETISNIQIPKYRINPRTNKAEGGVVEVDLAPGQSMDIPKKWLMLLLSRMEYMGRVKNGTFVNNTKQQNSIDEYFSTFVFNKFQPYPTPIPIGIYNINTNVATINKEARDLFCYLENKSKLVDVKITSESAIFLGVLIRKDIK